VGLEFNVLEIIKRGAQTMYKLSVRNSPSVSQKVSHWIQ